MYGVLRRSLAIPFSIYILPIVLHCCLTERDRLTVLMQQAQMGGLIESLLLPEPRVYPFTTLEAPKIHHHFPGHLPVTGTCHTEADDISPNLQIKIPLRSADKNTAMIVSNLSSISLLDVLKEMPRRISLPDIKHGVDKVIELLNLHYLFNHKKQIFSLWANLFIVSSVLLFSRTRKYLTNFFLCHEMGLFIF